MIDIAYTGDVRFNQEVIRKNHQLFFDELNKITSFQLHQFTNGVAKKLGFGICPYDTGGSDLVVVGQYRRGQGGAVQVWQFMEAFRLTKQPYFIRIRTDLWFTKKSIEVVINEIKQILNGDYDIGFFGSNWLTERIGREYHKEPVQTIGKTDQAGRTEDFLIMAKRDKVESWKTIEHNFSMMKPNKLRNGNKTFRAICHTNSIANKTECQIYLIRKHYKDYPTDKEVCKDYILSYSNGKWGKDGKFTNINSDKDSMHPAMKWWENKVWE